MKKNILIISSEFLPDPGGIANHAYHLAMALAEEKHHVTVLADISYSKKATVNTFRRTLPFVFRPILRNKITPVTYAKRIIKAIVLSAKANVIICSGRFSLWVFHLVKLFNSKAKSIAIVHGSELQLSSALKRKLLNSSLKKFSFIIAVSNYTKDFIPGAIKEKVGCIVIPNGIDNREFHSVDKQKKLSSQLHMITVGSVTERKGQENVIRAMPHLLKIFPGLFYHVVGVPAISERLQDVCRELGIENNVIFYGSVNRKELLRILEKASIKIMLSNHTNTGDFEGFGIAVLEANACGLPAIVSDFGGVTDAVINKRTGRTVNPYQPGNIGEAIDDIIGNYGEYSSNAISWARQHDWKNIILQYLAIIEGDWMPPTKR